MTLNARMMLVCLLTASFALFGCKEKPKPKPKSTKKVAKRPKKVVKRAPAKPKETVVTKEVTYKAGKTTLKGFIAYDSKKKGKRPGILVVHEWWGHNDYVRKRAKMLAKLGYVAFALDMYGDGKKAEHPKDAGKFAGAVMKRAKVAEARFQAARELLVKHEMTDAKKLAAIGYCFGGGVVLHAARVGVELAGVVSFHGSLKAVKKAKRGKVKAEILVLNGAADPMVTKKHIKAFKREMKRAKAKFTFIDYPGAQHAFTNPNATALGKKFKMPVSYQKEADEKSWAEMKKFFGRIFGS